MRNVGDYCINCNREYTNTYHKWCNSCQVNYLKENFTKWTSGNEKIDNFIQEMQLKINDVQDLVFEWISYNQFFDIKEVDKDDFSTAYSAKWKDGPLYWNNKKWFRGFDRSDSSPICDKTKKIALKCFVNSKILTDEFNKV